MGEHDDRVLAMLGKILDEQQVSKTELRAWFVDHEEQDNARFQQVHDRLAHVSNPSDFAKLLEQHDRSEAAARWAAVVQGGGKVALAVVTAAIIGAMGYTVHAMTHAPVAPAAEVK